MSWDAVLWVCERMTGYRHWLAPPRYDDILDGVSRRCRICHMAEFTDEPPQRTRITVRTTSRHGQYYAVARGREVARLVKRPRVRGWRRPTVASVAATPEAALQDVAEMLEGLR